MSRDRVFKLAAAAVVGMILISRVVTRAANATSTQSSTPLPAAAVISKSAWFSRPPTLSNIAVLSSALPETTLQTAWNEWMRSNPLQNTNVSAYAYDLTTHQVLAAIRPMRRETPASITKLFTSAAALSALGPNFTYQTTVAVTSGPTPTIYLVGGGDPWLEANGATDLENLAKSVAVSIKSAARVVGVTPLFGPSGYGIGWPMNELPYNFASRTSALMAERNEISIKVTQGASVGLRPQVVLKFDSALAVPSYFRIKNEAVTTPPASPSTLSITRRLGTNIIVVKGGLPLGSISHPSVQGAVLSVGNPPLFAATLFQKALEQAGVALSHKPAATTVMPSPVQTIATHISAPLSSDLKLQNQYSINQMADNLYRELGIEASADGLPTSSQSVMQNFLTHAGISAAHVQLDGSGLSPLDEISAQQVVKLLIYISAKPWYSVFRHSLIHLNSSRNSGILSPPQWFYHLPPNTDIWVKTGNLHNQWNYAGYARSANGNLIAFAILDDGAPTSQLAYRGSPIDKMMEDTAFWPNAPGPQNPARWDDPKASTTMPPFLKTTLKSLPGDNTGATLGISLVNVSTGQAVFHKNGGILLKAGLLSRLVLADAALKAPPVMPSAVTVQADGPISQGVLEGSLAVNGGHDALLTLHQLKQLAIMVRQSGIRIIRGPIDYVQPIAGFHSRRWPHAMPWEDLGQSWAPPSSAFIVQSGQASLLIRAGAVGHRPSVTVTPANTPITLVNHTMTVSKGSPSLHVQLQFNSDTYVISGTAPPGYSKTLAIAPPNAGRAAALDFVEALQQAGVKADGVIKPIPRNLGGPIVAKLASPPLNQWVTPMLNNISIAPAEAIAADLGPQLQPQIASVLGHSPGDLIDPTGAAVDNYLTATSVATMLSNAKRTPLEAPLTHFLTHHLWKTQSPEQYALAGYLRGPHGSLYAVTIIVSNILWNGHFAPAINP